MPKKKSFHRPLPAPFSIMLESARELIADLSSQVLIATVVAHYRGGQISSAQAAKACQMTEDNFHRGCVIVDDEARRMLMECENLGKEREERLAKINPTGEPKLSEPPITTP